MIRFENVVKTFGERVVLRNLSFSSQRGEILFVLGTSGTGKSVLLKAIVGLVRVTSGRIFIGEEEVTQKTEEEFFAIRKRCGMVMQNPALLESLNVFENVAYGLRRARPKQLSAEEIKNKVFECLDRVRLRGTEDLYPSEISFGMQKRASIARAIAMSPEILLIDEPTTGLDPVATTAVNQLIQKLSRELNTTSLVVSHDMAGALAIADRILVLDRGEIVAEGTPEQFLKSKVPLVQEFLAEVGAA